MDEQPLDPPLSKNKLKKLKRDLEWEQNREKRKARRKEKVVEKRARKRAARNDAAPAGSALSTLDGGLSRPLSTQEARGRRHGAFVQLPITIVLDCGFDDLMTDKEQKSLASQITRCYSDNHKAPFRAYMAISSFGGHLKERFESVMSGNYSSWRGVHFLEGDYCEAANHAQEWMSGHQGTKLAGAFVKEENPDQAPSIENSEDSEVVYLTSDSPNTLAELRPYSTYIIGGLVDRNRHKGICYKRAMDRGVKTAKLPIGDYMQMTSRFVLATNHVSEIILRWLELGDWGEAFIRVMPKRKGGMLKSKLHEGGGENGPTALVDDGDAGDGSDEDRQKLEQTNSKSEDRAPQVGKPGNTIKAISDPEKPGDKFNHHSSEDENGAAEGINGCAMSCSKIGNGESLRG